ncbi:phosphatidylinositol 4-kinase gamma 8-like [Macadamia integrifolia]|uniref:phosphatidylinositol 4-kinase gamma 8-like n=1 Tax=Macadamia integrifolia TaxID=60698 RepID=UPI001C4EACD5|nr:phosphatidylinositol 4-kinase gamma 8-like [Macadamia integrifolia]XP_042513529.1 phosphatidylinositol 4-kinase gamma 8-like [Macadamia integrifolia]XP_042513530.1 phosphatidylinositol 4-kinase gamma 8-like [Macadamia integrifolia]XP_042513531.1 phosphatidylinositol 4-kinase gamma 8-like [Macadamia integrifolia]
MRITQMAVAVDHHHGFKPFARTQRCRLRSFTHLDTAVFELEQYKLAQSLKQSITGGSNHRRSFSTPCLSFTTSVEEEANSNAPRVEIVGGSGGPRVRALVVESAIAVASGVEPVPVSSGLGGAYFLRSRNGDNIAVAKPIDEEPWAINNPKGFAGRILGQPGLKRSIRVGETGVREVAAYLLDHGSFAGVPPTALVKISQVPFHVNDSETTTPPLSKIASLQRFVDHDSDAGDLGPSSFSVSYIHRIGILDVRLLNLDRHSGNILVKYHRNSINYVNDSYAVEDAELVPIDHGLCLPEMLDDPYFEWLHWPQASVPFSEAELKYISKLDPFKDALLLRKELPSLRESSIRVLVLCTIFLKRAANAGLSLSDIGDMMTREFCGNQEGPSVLEALSAKVMASMNCSFIGQEENSKEETEIFEFEIGCEDGNSNVFDLPRLLQSRPGMNKPPKVPVKLSSSKSMRGFPNDQTFTDLLHEEDDINSDTYNDDDNGDDDHKVGGLIKSMSFSIPNRKIETDGISFKCMSEEEWSLFLVCFEKLLPKVFDDRKSMGLKQRLGTSCSF